MMFLYARRQVPGNGVFDGVSCLLPESTFYAFPDISSFGLSSWDFAKYLVQEHKVAVVPGSIFGRRGEGHVRISFAADAAKLREDIAGRTLRRGGDVRAGRRRESSSCRRHPSARRNG